jgi:hypothetical protein
VKAVALIINTPTGHTTQAVLAGARHNMAQMPAHTYLQVMHAQVETEAVHHLLVWEPAAEVNWLSTKGVSAHLPEIPTPPAAHLPGLSPLHSCNRSVVGVTQGTPSPHQKATPPTQQPTYGRATYHAG